MTLFHQFYKPKSFQIQKHFAFHRIGHIAIKVLYGYKTTLLMLQTSLTKEILVRIVYNFIASAISDHGSGNTTEHAQKIQIVSQENVLN